MDRWKELVRESLKALGADNEFALGTKLRLQLDRAALEEGLSLEDALAGRSFSDFLSTVPGIVLIKTPGKDMLVGFEDTPRPTERIEGARRRSQDTTILRPDVYEALTRARPTPYYYVPQTDMFSPEAIGEECIPLPLVTVESLKETRRQFAQSLEDEAKKAHLLRVLAYDPNFLTDFQREIGSMRLARRWHEFNYQMLKNKLEEWARSNNLSIRAQWFTQQITDAIEIGAHEVMVDLIRHMTPEELRSLQVPFRAVEAMYRALSQER